MSTLGLMFIHYTQVQKLDSLEMQPTMTSPEQPEGGAGLQAHQSLSARAGGGRSLSR